MDMRPGVCRVRRCRDLEAARRRSAKQVNVLHLIGPGRLQFSQRQPKGIFNGLAVAQGAIESAGKDDGRSPLELADTVDDRWNGLGQ